MTIFVAIACNLFLVIINLFLLAKIQKWHRSLRQTRQQLTLNERKIQADVDDLLQNISLLPVVTDGMVQKKRAIASFISQIKVLLNILQSVTVFAKKIR